MSQFIGIDDGTGSARAGVFDAAGRLLGGAMLAAVASGHQPDLGAAMAAMSGRVGVISPCDGAIAACHSRNYRVFQRMQADYAAYVARMAEPETPEHDG